MLEPWHGLQVPLWSRDVVQMKKGEKKMEKGRVAWCPHQPQQGKACGPRHAPNPLK